MRQGLLQSPGETTTHNQLKHTHMTKTPQSTYGIDFYLAVPSSIEELEQIHGRAGVALELSIKQDVAHTILGKIRRKLAEALAAEGFALPTKTVGDKETTLVPDKNWFAAGFTALGWDTAKKTTVVQAIADEVGYDVSSERGLSGGPSKTDLKDAEGYISAVASGATTFDRLKGNLERRNPGLDIPLEDDGSITVENLASALRTDRRRIEAELKAKQSELL
jgi:hypothetical protein